MADVLPCAAPAAPPRSRKLRVEPKPIAPAFLSVAQVAKLLNRSAAGVYDLCERGELRATRAGGRLTIPAPEVRAYLERELARLGPSFSSPETNAARLGRKRKDRTE